MGLFSKFKDIFKTKEKEEKTSEEIKKYDTGLEKTRNEFVSKLNLLGIKYTKVNEEYFEELENLLIMADIGVKTVMDFMDRLRRRVKSENITDTKFLGEVIVDELFIIYVNNESITDKININPDGPTVILMVGVNGVGKTTTIAKLAYKYKSEGKSVMMIAGDTFRAGAVEQLKIWADRTDSLFFGKENIDPAGVIFDGLDKAIEENVDIVLIDTAGRLQIDTDMMAELMLIEKKYPINEKLLVIDSMTGQEAVDIARNFDEQIGITGIILTKLDGDTRGGAALSVTYSTKKPIKLVSTGEKIEPLENFYPDRMANRILGMGDVVTLVEKAQKAFDEENAKELEEAMLKNTFSFEDFLKMQKQMKMLGSLEGILGMLPIKGLNKDDRQKISHEGEKQLKKIEVMISSMTKEERKNPDILNSSRKKRIAKGAGVSLDEFNKFIQQFDMMRKMMKGLGGFKDMMKGKNQKAAQLNMINQANKMKHKYRFR